MRLNLGDFQFADRKVERVVEGTNQRLIKFIKARITLMLFWVVHNITSLLSRFGLIVTRFSYIDLKCSSTRPWFWIFCLKAAFQSLKNNLTFLRNTFIQMLFFQFVIKSFKNIFEILKSSLKKYKYKENVAQKSASNYQFITPVMRRNTIKYEYVLCLPN